MIATSRRKRVCMTLLVLNLLFIWGNSLLPASVSAAFSSRVGKLIKMILSLPVSNLGQSGGQHLLRKLAHFSEFASLGLLLSWYTGMVRKPYLLAAGTGFLAACLDETIQFFVPGRGPGVLDVLIDTCGVVLGIGCLLLGYHVSRKLKKAAA